MTSCRPTRSTTSSAGPTRRCTTGAGRRAAAPRTRRGPRGWSSRAHAVLGQGDAALYHADRSAAVVATAGLADFDLAYAHEARARALACLGRLDEAEAELAAARAVPIADDEDRQIVDGDLAAGPWFGLAAAAAGAVTAAAPRPLLTKSHGQKWPRTSHGTRPRRHRRSAYRRYGGTMSVEVELGESGERSSASSTSPTSSPCPRRAGPTCCRCGRR